MQNCGIKNLYVLDPLIFAGNYKVSASEYFRSGLYDHPNVDWHKSKSVSSL